MIQGRGDVEHNERENTEEQDIRSEQDRFIGAIVPFIDDYEERHPEE